MPTPRSALRLGILCLLAAAVAACDLAIGTGLGTERFRPTGNPFDLPIDAEGWTVFAPSADSRIAYVSGALGSDANALTYSRGDAALGSNPFAPTGPVRAFASYEAARAAVRDGYPDWILFRRGEQYAGVQIALRSGRGPSEPSLVAAYGDGSGSGALPVLKPAEGRDLIVDGGRGGTSFAAAASLDLYAEGHDPRASPGNLAKCACGFSLVEGSAAIRFVLLEGIRARCFGGNVIQAYDRGVIEDVVIRRCVILDNFSTSRADGHSQGLFAGMVDGILLEENVFDHNGWYSRDDGNADVELPGEATMFNHNTYFADCHGVTFRNNVFLRSSSIQNKFTANYGAASSSRVAIQGNLYVDGEIGISIGGNADDPYRFAGVLVSGNVFTETGRSRPTARTLGWGLDIQDWDGGEASGNFFIHNTTPEVDNTYAICVSGSSRDVDIAGNVVYGQNETGANPWSYGIIIASGGAKGGIEIRGNEIQEPSGPIVIARLQADQDAAGISFESNRYYVPSRPERAFLVGEGAAALYVPFASWKHLTRDRSWFSRTEFADPSRSIAAYQASIGKEASIDAFVEACRAQGRDSWDERYSARSVVDWLKAGFSRR